MIFHLKTHKLLTTASEIARLKSVQSIYSKRRSFTRNIDKFWNIVLSQHPEFSEYIRSSDFKFLELIKDIYVSWDVASTSASEDSTPGDFSITFEFEGLDDDFPEQTIVKKFKLETFDPEDLPKSKSKKRDIDNSDDEADADETERLVSESIDIIWPKSYDSINPSKIQDKKSDAGKKNYRAGMKSFFGWFKWTGRKPGKEFPSGDDFARLFSEEIFPYAVKYYTEAQRDGLEEEEDSDASEPLDLSDEEGDSRGTKRKHEEDDE
ncbi:Vacuolar protein sorting-associated protein [Wickerhamomyces ciferrii]|uniref:Vacuolar protein sorting-associated protein n=1 Tax=Wickerhamomyces ciferrii (strain ATCC 14091 / BCRC 22168 / CBS 111 / JCM 3599 / NBRC 0793 / NRRL Y-1031 F-60-10) TaxID=1206466 RepID=K0KLA5_WICCF|nr:Vacuolar protein sorting-associated protein [Wickerhamomyces ciferrii]CCH42174.1 Vacuolar protein sorting-associated protein [Wickerhamomyces ciferrii]